MVVAERALVVVAVVAVGEGALAAEGVLLGTGGLVADLRGHGVHNQEAGLGDTFDTQKTFQD